MAAPAAPKQNACIGWSSVFLQLEDSPEACVLLSDGDQSEDQLDVPGT